MTTKTIEDNVLIFPNQLHFQEDRNHQFKSDYIIISSAWLHGIAFQIIPSILNIFDISVIEGFVPPCESRRVPIILNSIGNHKNFSCSFTVNIAEASEKDLIDDNPHLFWKMNPKFFTKVLPCEIRIRDPLPMEDSSPENEEIIISPPKGHILELMIKNVSKNTPLLPEEAEELNSIRVVMSKDHWNQWLKFAREEKKKRNTKGIVHSGTPQSLPATSTEDSHLISAAHAAIQTASQYHIHDTIQSIESQKSQSKYSIQRDDGQMIPDVGSSRPKGHPSKPTTNHTNLSQHSSSMFDFNTSFSTIIPSPHISSSSVAQNFVPASRSKKHSTHSTSVLGESDAPKRSTVPSPPSFTQPTANRTVKSASSPPTYAHTTPHVSNKSPIQPQKLFESFKISHKMSAPAERISEPGIYSLSKQLDSRKIMSASQPVKISQNFDDDVRDSTQIQPSVLPSPRVSPLSQRNKQRGPSHDNFSVNYVPQSNNSVKSQIQHPAQKQLSSPTPALALSPAHHPSSNSIHETRASHNNVPEIVKSSTLRIQSAFAAAQSLKASLEADLESGSANSEKTSSTLAMINAMLSSLEKSKNSLNSLAHDANPSEVIEQKKQETNHVKQSIDTPQLERYQEILSKVEMRPNLSINYDDIRDKVEHDSVDQRFDPPDPDFEDFHQSDYTNHRSQAPHRGKWTGESIGVDEEEDYPEDINSEMSAIDASDWPPPNNSKRIPPKRGFIPAEERLRPQSASSISQRSLSTSRMDSKRGQRNQAMDFSKSSSYSRDDYEGFYDQTISSRKKSILSSDRQNSPHHSLKTRNEKSSLTIKPTSSSHISKKSVHTVRSAKGMPRVVRLCVSHGPMIKTYDDNPLRIDVENCTLDVVWREKHIYGPDKRNPSNGLQTTSTLRRERYNFDEVYTGPDAGPRLSSYTKRRIKTSLLNTRGIVFLCLAGGDFGTNSTAYLEPPISVILGDSGGQGLISSTLDEIFKHKSKYGGSNPNPPPPHRFYSGSTTPIKRSLDRSNSPACHPLSNDYVLFSAVIICDRQVYDLLGSSSSHQKSSSKVIKISQKSDGTSTINNVTKLQLRSVADFERIAGVLLGRRAALKELTSVICKMNSSSSSSLSAAETVMSHHDVSVPDIPWLLATENEACILFSLATTGEGVSLSSHGIVNYYFTCPCGKYWSLPGSEICLLAEAISALPHTSPPSLYQAGEITKLLVDPNGPDMDYITVASVANQRKELNSYKSSVDEDEEIIQNALQSFRVVSQLSSIT